MTYHNFWNATKTVIRGKFISLQAYIKKQQKCQVNNLTLYLKISRKRRTEATKSQQKKEKNKN